MSKEFLSLQQEIAQNFINSLTHQQRHFLFGVINFNRKNLMIDWDLDQTLELTENPIKEKVLDDFGKDYRARRVDERNSIAKWLIQDGIPEKKATDYEELAWVNNKLLMQGPPNKALRILSYLAYLRGVPQSVTTVRVQGLRQTTYKWLDKYFPWIPAGSVNFRIAMAVPGREFKIKTILSAYKANPNMVHVDDDLSIIKPLSEAEPYLGLIHIKYPSDGVEGLNHSGNRIFASREELESIIWTYAR